MNIFTQFFSKNTKDPKKQHQAVVTDLMRREAKIGGRLFGEVPEGTTREFFCLNDTTWVWFEQNSEKTRTTRYVIRDKGIFKSVDNAPYESVGEAELQNLERAIELYAERVNEKLYKNVAPSYA